MDLESVIFTNGTLFYSELAKKYITHDKGLFIMTPSGAGKTYFCDKQSQPNWIDGDIMWCDAGAQPQPETKWWDKGLDVINRVEQRCDVVTADARDKGFWIMGSVNYWLKPDAIVIPDWETLTKQIKMRQEGDYDGGLTENHHEQLKNHINVIEEWNTKHGVPRYGSVQEAVDALTL